MPAVFGVLAAIAFIWAAVKDQIVYKSMVDTLPPQFQDDELALRYAFHEYALHPSTPLPLQAEYVNSLRGGCAGSLCASIAVFSAQNVVLGCLSLIAFVWGVIHTIRSWRTYRENCARAENDAARDQ